MFEVREFLQCCLLFLDSYILIPVLRKNKKGIHNSICSSLILGTVLEVLYDQNPVILQMKKLKLRESLNNLSTVKWHD